MPSGPFLSYSPSSRLRALSLSSLPPFRPPASYDHPLHAQEHPFSFAFCVFSCNVHWIRIPLASPMQSWHKNPCAADRHKERSDCVFIHKSDDAKTHQLKKPVAHAHRLGRIIATLVHLCIMQYYGLKAITRTKSLYSGLLHRFQQKTVLSGSNQERFLLVPISLLSLGNLLVCAKLERHLL